MAGPLDGRKVFVTRGEARYPEHAPYHPHVAYPECAAGPTSDEPNAAYEGVRRVFQLAGLDAERFGAPEWNPLAQLMREGEVVVLKPNMVKEAHPRDPQGWKYVLTHGSVIRAVADYVWKAIGPKGRIILADAPQTDSSFSVMTDLLGLATLRDFYAQRGLRFDIVDLRREEWRSEKGVVVSRRQLPGDPEGGVAFDLGDASEFTTHRGAGRYYGADYDESVVNHHHSGGHHEYLIAGSVIRADVLFSLPKLKTHKKAGITVSLKNLVGVNADKNWLPHHTEGSPAHGGDEHPNPGLVHRIERLGARWVRRIAVNVPVLGPRLLQGARSVGTRAFGDTENVVRSGNWFGNDTVWRMCLDLNKLVLYGNPDGTLRAPTPENRKRHYVLVDGIIAGQGRGPMNPDPVEAGIVLFGVEPPAVDSACGVLMGFDPDKIPILAGAFRCRKYPITSLADWRKVEIVSDVAEWSRGLGAIPVAASLRFEPHFGWKGHIEREERREAHS